MNSSLPDGTTLEVGEMIDPRSGKMTSFEEMWKDEEEMSGETVLFVKNLSGTVWQARVGKWQLAMGRNKDGNFWAWQSEKVQDREWLVRYSTSGIRPERLRWLPEQQGTAGWVEGSHVAWEGDQWVVLEIGV